MSSTLFCVAQSFLRPSFDDVVEDTRATSTGKSSTVASSDRRVNMQTMSTKIERSLGAW